MNTLAEKWAHKFRVEGGPWPEDDHWSEQWYAIEREMERSGDVAKCGGGGYEGAGYEGGDKWLGCPYVFIDNSGFLLSGGDDKAFPAIRIFSKAEIAELKWVWAEVWAGIKYICIDKPNEIEWLEKNVAKAEGSPKPVEGIMANDFSGSNGLDNAVVDAIHDRVRRSNGQLEIIETTAQRIKIKDNRGDEPHCVIVLSRTNAIEVRHMDIIAGKKCPEATQIIHKDVKGEIVTYHHDNKSTPDPNKVADFILDGTLFSESAA